jgi:hypothetical protein
MAMLAPNGSVTQLMGENVGNPKGLRDERCDEDLMEVAVRSLIAPAFAHPPILAGQG